MSFRFGSDTGGLSGWFLGKFGFGDEIGIITKKLHARGPMGLKELTTTKYIIYGDGQIRE